MAGRPGRNAPCPCGSGRKYKQCCLRRDAAQEAEVKSIADRRPELTSMSLQSLHELVAEEARRAPPERAQAVADLLAGLSEAAEYEAAEDEIERAALELERYRPEFEALLDDPEAAWERAERLFAEPDFDSLRITADDVQRAFEAVGFPQMRLDAPEQSARTADEAMLHLADEEYRLRTARKLMMLVPRYVKAGRHIDAWIIQHSAVLMLEEPKEANPFLIEAFSRGMEEWSERTHAQTEEAIAQAGLSADELEAMSPEEVTERLRANMADPARAAQMDAYYQAHPELHALVEADLCALEEDVAEVLEREDARLLYPPPEKVDPWARTVLARIDPFVDDIASRLEKGQELRECNLRGMRDAFHDAARRMAAELYALPEERDRLVARTEAYRQALAKAGDERAASRLRFALLRLQLDPFPEESLLPYGVAYLALRAHVHELLQGEAQAEG